MIKNDKQVSASTFKYRQLFTKGSLEFANSVSVFFSLFVMFAVVAMPCTPLPEP